MTGCFLAAAASLFGADGVEAPLQETAPAWVIPLYHDRPRGQRVAISLPDGSVDWESKRGVVCRLSRQGPTIFIPVSESDAVRTILAVGVQSGASGELYLGHGVSTTVSGFPFFTKASLRCHVLEAVVFILSGSGLCLEASCPY